MAVRNLRALPNLTIAESLTKRIYKDKLAKEKGLKKVLSLLVVGLLLAGTYVGSVMQMNADQAQYAQYLAKLQQNPTTVQSKVGANITVELFLIAYHHLDLSPRQNLIDQGWTPDCLKWCFGGITYYHDPTTL